MAVEIVASKDTIMPGTPRKDYFRGMRNRCLQLNLSDKCFGKLYSRAGYDINLVIYLF